MLRFVSAFVVLVAVQCGVFLGTTFLEVKFQLISNYLPEEYLDIPITPVNLAYAASALVAFFCTIRWPMFALAFVASSVCALLALFPVLAYRFSGYVIAFWAINALLSYVISQRLLHRRELWSIDWRQHLAAEASLFGGLLLANLVLVRIYNDDWPQRIETALYAGASVLLLALAINLEKRARKSYQATQAIVEELKTEKRDLVAAKAAAELELTARQKRIVDLESIGYTHEERRVALETENSTLRAEIEALKTSSGARQVLEAPPPPPTPEPAAEQQQGAAPPPPPLGAARVGPGDLDDVMSGLRPDTSTTLQPHSDTVVVPNLTRQERREQRQLQRNRDRQ